MSISKILYFLNRYSGILNTALSSYGVSSIFDRCCRINNYLALVVGGSTSVSELRIDEERV